MSSAKFCTQCGTQIDQIAIEGDPNPEAHLLKLKAEVESKTQK